jgi:shikimate dehydrogenase
MADRYALIGNPVSHSKSPLIHAQFAQATGQDIEYTAVESTADGLAKTIHAFRAAGGKGMNVTSPSKLLAMELATDRLERAALAGATNTLKFKGDRIYADNVDGVGLVTDIRRNLGVALAGRRVLLPRCRGCSAGRRSAVSGAEACRNGHCQPHAGQGRRVGCYCAESGPDRRLRLRGSLERTIRCHRQLHIGQREGRAAIRAVKGFAHSALAYDLVYGKGLTPFLDGTSRRREAPRRRRRHAD